MLQAWTETNTRLATVTNAHTKIWGKKQLTILVNRVTKEHVVWLLDIVELFILGLDALGQLGATVAIMCKQLHVK